MLEKIWYIDEERGFPYVGFALRMGEDQRANLVVFNDLADQVEYVDEAAFNAEGEPGTYHFDGPGSVVYRDNPEASGRIAIDRSGKIPRFYYANVAAEEKSANIAEIPLGEKLYPIKWNPPEMFGGLSAPIGGSREGLLPSLNTARGEIEKSANIAETETGETDDLAGLSGKFPEAGKDKREFDPPIPVRVTDKAKRVISEILAGQTQKVESEATIETSEQDEAAEETQSVKTEENQSPESETQPEE